MKIVVLAWGLSPERDVSLTSGSLIANTLIDNGHDVLLVDLYLGVESDENQLFFFNKQSQKRFYFQVPTTEPNLKKLKEESGNGENLIGKRVIEIIPITGFYDYKNKYQPGMAKEVCPADINSVITQQLQSIALSVHKTLRLGFYSRIDFILDNENEIYCLEANTLPGMTPTSLLPQEAEAFGITFNELSEKIARSENIWVKMMI